MLNGSVRHCLSASFILLLAVLSSCKPRLDESNVADFETDAQSESDRAIERYKYGFIQDSRHLLIYKKDGSTIRLCGKDQDILGRVINTWAKALGRHYNIVSDCDKPDINFFDSEDPYAIKMCKQFDLEKRGYAEPTIYPQKIVDCHAWNSGELLLTHEVGHLFGLCDQYKDSIGNCLFTTAAVKGSVMNGCDRNTLSPDDVIGIQTLAKQVNQPLGGGATPLTCGGWSLGDCNMLPQCKYKVIQGVCEDKNPSGSGPVNNSGNLSNNAGAAGCNGLQFLQCKNMSQCRFDFGQDKCVAKQSDPVGGSGGYVGGSGGGSNTCAATPGIRECNKQPGCVFNLSQGKCLPRP
jgi:hypothetical protein